MQSLKRVVKEILGCSLMEVYMLCETKIDIQNTVQTITEYGLSLNMENLYREAFYDKVTDVLDFNRDKGADEKDFDLYYNGACDTHIYIDNGKYDFYKENYPDRLKEIEEYMDMKFEEGI